MDQINQQSAAENALTGQTEELSGPDLLTYEGHQSYNMEKYEEAWQKFNAVIETKGDKAEALDYTNRAVAYTEIKDNEKSIIDCQKAIKIDPKFMQAYYHHSKVMAYRGKLGGALDILKQALAKDKECLETITRIKLLEVEINLDKAVPKDDPKRLALNQYLDWLKGQGAQFHSLKVVMLPNKVDHTVISTADIKQQEPILFIPKDLITTCEGTMNVPACNWLQLNPKIQEGIHKKEQNCMALWYLDQIETNDNKSKNLRMLKALRQDNSQCITLWSGEEFAVTKGSSLQNHILNVNNQMDYDHYIIDKQVEPCKDKYTLQQYQEAYTIMDLNIWNMTMAKVETCGFVPFIHYFQQHDDSQTFTIYDEEMKGFLVIAKKFIPRGQSINMSAPAPNNDFQLCKRGEMSGLRETTVPITITLAQEDPLFLEKMSLVGQQFSKRQFMVSSAFNTDQFMNLIFYLRYFCFSGTKDMLILLKKTEIDRKIQNKIQFNDATAFDGTKIPSFSAEMEFTVWCIIKREVDTKLKQYDISFEKSQERVAKHNDGTEPFKNNAQKMAWTYLNMEQGQLNMISRYADLFISLLKMPWDDFKKQVETNPAVQGVFKQYVASSIYPHQQDAKMISEGVEPPQRWAVPGQEDNTYSRLEGDTIVYVHPDQAQASAQMQQQMAQQQAAQQSNPNAPQGSQPAQGQPGQDSNLGGIF